MGRLGGVLRTRHNADVAIGTTPHPVTGEPEYLLAITTKTMRSASTIMNRAEMIILRDQLNEILNN